MRAFLPRAAMIACAVAALAWVAAIAWELRTRPCVGDPVPDAMPELAARAWELPVVARPDTLREENEHSFMISYATDGRTEYALGPFLLEDRWSQGGNGAHTLGPPVRTAILLPSPRAVPPAPWSIEIFSGMDYPMYVTRTEVRRGADPDALLVVTCSGSSTPPGRLELPPQPGSRSYEPCTPIGWTFRVLHHPSGHRTFRKIGHVVLAALALAIAALLAATARRRAIAAEWRAGVIDTSGAIVSEGAHLRVQGAERFVPGVAVLFRTTEPRAPYRADVVAGEVVDGTPAGARKTARREAVAAFVLALAAAAAAVHAVFS